MISGTCHYNLKLYKILKIKMIFNNSLHKILNNFKLNTQPNGKKSQSPSVLILQEHLNLHVLLEMLYTFTEDKTFSKTAIMTNY